MKTNKKTNKTERIHIRLTKDQRKELLKRAKTQKQTITDYLISKALAS